MAYDVLLLSLALDLFAISVLTYGIYFRRHHRRDLTLGFMGVNIGLFAVASFVSTRPVGLAFGIGLFALLSVIRLRSTQVTQEEIGYYFVAIVIGLTTGLSPDEHWGTTITLTAVLVGVMYVADHPRVLRRHERRIVVLDKVYRDDFALKAALAKRLHGEVTNVVVMSVDFARKQSQVDVRFRPHPFPKPHHAKPEPEPQPVPVPEPGPAPEPEHAAEIAPEPELASAPPDVATESGGAAAEIPEEPEAPSIDPRPEPEAPEAW
ncbi:MAG: DUF4956 domain-containing protein [Acidimicrobiia bacterium]|jgi:hypothetical protein